MTVVNKGFGFTTLLVRRTHQVERLIGQRELEPRRWPV